MTDIYQGHRMSKRTMEADDEVMAWRCVICGGWVNEWHPHRNEPCPGRPTEEDR